MRAALVTWCLTVALVLAAVRAEAQEYVVDRVVAVVGDKPVLLSTLHRRARPHLSVMSQTVTGTGEQVIAKAKIYRQLLDQLVDEQLVRRDADHHGVAVQAADVDSALDHVAGQNGMTRSQLLVAVERSAGMTEADYRAEIERQVLEGKMLQLQVQQRNAVVREEELQALYAKVKREDPEDTPAYDEVRSALLARLQTERMQRLRVQWIRRLREQAYVEIRWVP